MQRRTQDSINQTENPLQGQELIKFIYGESAGNGRISTSYANTLEANIYTVFNSDHKFIYELLQNADDAGATRVQFTLSETDLVISHNGSQFTAEDVNKICDNAKSDSYKAKQLDKTGYKGVGFKAVFCISKKVTVVSDPYCFRFDESYWKQTEQAKYPWPVIPIWTEVTTLHNQLPHDQELNVHFILSEINREHIQAELDAIFKSTEVLLLLRHIREVVIEPRQIIITKSHSEHSLISLERREQDQVTDSQLWLTETMEIKISPSVQSAIQRLGAAECPNKLKQANAVNLTFAAHVTLDHMGNRRLTGMKNARIYCYLPTQVNAGLPYLVNADFLLNQDRTLLMNNVWNQFLLRSIAREQFCWLARLAVDPHWSTSILNLLALPQVGGMDEALNVSYQEGYHTGIADIAFIPSVKPHQLLKFKQAIIDKTEFFKLFAEQYSDDLLCDAGVSCLVHYGLTAQNRLNELAKYNFKIKLYNYVDLLDRIENYLQQRELTIENAVVLLRYFKEAQNLQPGEIELLRNKAILLCSDHIPRQPQVCYLDKGSVELARQFQLAVVHTQIMKQLDLVDWLQQILKMGMLNKQDIISNTITKLISSGGVTARNSVEILRFIYTAIRERVTLTENNYQGLRLFPVLRRDGQLAPLSTVYFPSGGPCNIPNALVLADGYMLHQDDINSWKNLLIRMGIKTEIGLTIHRSQPNINTITVREIRERFSDPQLFTEYYNELRSQFRIHLTKREAQDHEKLINFITYDFFHLLDQEIYYALFWEAFRANWQQLQQPCRYNKNLSRNNMIFDIPHYLVYYLKKHACIRVVGKNDCKKASEVYAPSLIKMGDDLPLAIADIPGGLSLEQAKFLGFKTEPKFEDCLQLLSNPTCQKQPKQLSLIYRWLLKNHPLDDTQIQNLRQWCKNNSLLAANNTLQPISKLSYFDLIGVMPETATWLHKVDLSSEEISRLAELFAIPRANQKQLTKLKGEPIEISLKRKIDSAVRICLPMLAILEKQITSEELLTILSRMLDEYHLVAIYYCPDLVVSDAKLNTFFDKNILYLSERWTKPCVRIDVATALGEQCFHLSTKTVERFRMILNQASSKSELAGILEVFQIKRDIYDELLMFQEKYKPNIDVRHRDVTENPIHDEEAETPIPAVNTVGANTVNTPSRLFYTPVRLHKLSNASLTRGKSSSGSKSRRGGIAKNLFNSTHTPKEQDEYLKRGRAGEQKFYEHIYTKVQAQQGWAIQENDEGFTASLNEHVVLNVEWPNKNKEKFQPLDFKITYKEQIYIFEVKSTNAPKRNFVNLSTHEWEKLVEYKSHYALVCIFAIKSHQPTFDVIWNPFKKIAQNSMKPDNMILRWGYNTTGQLLAIPAGVTAEKFVGDDEPEDYVDCRLQ